MASKYSVFDCHICTVADIEESAIRCTLLSFTGDAVFKPVNNNIRSFDSDVPAIIGILRFCLVSNRGKSSPGYGQWLFVDGKCFDIGNLIEIPDDGSVHIYLSIFIRNEDISLRRSVVLVGSKPDVALYIGV